jgi:hypothetical protein
MSQSKHYIKVKCKLCDYVIIAPKAHAMQMLKEHMYETHNIKI